MNPPNKVLKNPGGGTTTIIGYDKTYLTYIRGRSKFRVSIIDLYKAYKTFYGTQVSSIDLKRINPKVFDSRAPHFGHSCNCTTLFMLLKDIGLVKKIHGKGVRGNPFFVDIIC